MDKLYYIKLWRLHYYLRVNFNKLEHIGMIDKWLRDRLNEIYSYSDYVENAKERLIGGQCLEEWYRD